MRTLVTGATGFVGLVLTRRLLDIGWKVRAATREDRKPVAGAERVVVGEIGSKTDWSHAVEGVDLVFHLAGLQHIVSRADQERAAYDEVNAQGTRRLVEAALEAGVQRFIHVSTAKVAGDASVRPFLETDPPQPADEYARSKLRSEELVKNASAKGRLQFSILRPPLVYGPGVRANFLSLIRAVDRGVPLPFAKIENRRSYVAVANLADALLFVATSVEAANETMFVSDCEDVSTAELIRRIAASLGRRPRLVPVPWPILRATATALGKSAALRKLTGSLQVDTTRIRGFGWRPILSPEDALAETAAWFRTRT